MEHDLKNCRATLLRSPSYCASPVFLSGVGWQVEQAGHVLVDKISNVNTVAIVVGRVSNQRFFVTANGNWGRDSNKFCDFSITKFLFIIERPNDTPFAEDFDVTLKHLGKIQSKMASTPKSLNFISTDCPDKTLRFTHNVFAKRVRFSPFSPLRVMTLCTCRSLTLTVNPLSNTRALSDSSINSVQVWPCRRYH